MSKILLTVLIYLAKLVLWPHASIASHCTFSQNTLRFHNDETNCIMTSQDLQIVEQILCHILVPAACVRVQSADDPAIKALCAMFLAHSHPQNQPHSAPDPLFTEAVKAQNWMPLEWRDSKRER